jgi:Domain of unknown function (DUF4407)
MKELLNYKGPEVTRFDRILLWCSGTDIEILKQTTHADKVKLFCLGGIILATGLLASLSGGYAFYTIFKDPKVYAAQDSDETIYWGTVFVALIFGALWGMIILNLDRYIVSSTGKGDGTERITWDELKTALPRMVLGAIIAITISAPLETRIFKSEIDAELNIRQQEHAKQRRAQVDAESDAEYTRLVDDRKNQEKLRDNYWANKAQHERDLVAEMNQSGNRGFGPEARQIRALIVADSISIAQTQGNLTVLNQKLEEIQTNRKQAYEIVDKEAKKLNGLLERIKISHDIGGTITWFIIFLFLALELTPIFFKLMVIKGPYDVLEENVQEIVKARQGIEHKVKFYKKATDGHDSDLTIFHAANQLRDEQIEIIKAQQALSQQIIAVWKAQKEVEIKENPDKFVQS